MGESKVVLITGGSRGIGAETAKLFAENHFSVVISYRKEKQAAEDVKQRILLLGSPCLAVSADMSKEDDVKSLFHEVDKFGKLSVLVNNAGVLDTQSRLEDISVDRFRKVLDVNMLSCFMCTKEAIKRMAKKYGGAGGTIVNVSSGAAKTGSPNEYVDYACSKGAMDTFTRGAALELAEEGIRVNSVRPGLIYTDMHALGGEPNRVDRLKHKLPLARGGEPREVAEAIFWLASEKSSFVTGSFIDTTGGL